ncbi:MATE family efflux transporter [Flaviaesturariibacter flavus]|uniref:MATE family efflux transporter n=1 Tax=Flaviaesturariibacter flavus TaxID=2502780 RepID=A0A4R1B866_9BACT|nr:MATE family efflux transporter [Flaviaesturariibacter flavus]TCJ12695.1 MATE family efflux transporter [Flaviaesturariibacter flavus]
MALEKRKALLEGPILQSLLRLAIPIVLANLLQAGYQIVDAFWVGRLGGAAVAAVSVSTPVTFLTLGLGTGFAIAGSVLIAQYYGAGDHRMVGHVAAQTLLMVIVVSLLLGTVAFIFAPDFLRLLKVAPEVYQGALGFMRVSFVGLVFNFSFFVFQSIMRGVGNATVPVWIVLGTVILNFALDPLFIFGWGPVPGYGVMGAALATLSTQVVAALAGFLILLRGRRGVHLRLADFRPDGKHIRRAFNIGLPASVEQSMRALGLTVMTFLIASFGTETVASYGAGSNLLQVVMIPALGLSMAISTLVGQNIGAGQIARAARIGKLGAMLGFSALTILGVMAYLLAPQLVAFFVPEDPAVIRGGSEFLRTMCLAWGFLGLQMSLSGVLRASGNMVQVMMLTIISQWVLQFPLAWMLAEKSGMAARGIWLAFPVTNIVMSLVTMGIYARGDWKKGRLTDESSVLSRAVRNEAEAKEGALK